MKIWKNSLQRLKALKEIMTFKEVLKMKRKTMLKIKRTVLKTSVWVAIINCFIFVCWLDAPSWIPTIIFAVSFVWLVIMAWANGLFDKGGEK